MREAAEPPHDVAVVLRLAQVPPTEAAAELDGAFLIGQIFGVPERQIEESLQLHGDDAIVTCVDRGSGAPRKELRGNWSSRISRASAPSGVAFQLSRSPRAAASCSEKNRSRNR